MDFNDAQSLCLEVNDAGFTAELSHGQVVVVPWASPDSGKILHRMQRALFPLANENDWVFFQSLAVHVPPHRDMRLPDLIVAPEAAELYDGMHIFGHSTLLVVEVCSKGTAAVDYAEKPNEYARAGVPLYLIIDQLADPQRLVLMSGPVDDLAPQDCRPPYEKTITIHRGDKLVLPDPFNLTIETDELFTPGGSTR
ncbi:Uma2 family endonuclease [Nonomuraea sp. NPDC050556]|uniref:Uma2 family endonuclease n=1 Tax=Nonomuraea sp. NPDC050556 TaxID=3364369 RepID=UPI00378D8864